MFVKTEVNSAGKLYINKHKNINNLIIFHLNVVTQMCGLCSDRFKNHKQLSTKQTELQ